MQVGDEVKITNGNLTGMRGVIVEIDDHPELPVEVKMSKGIVEGFVIPYGFDELEVI